MKLGFVLLSVSVLGACVGHFDQTPPVGPVGADGVVSEPDSPPGSGKVDIPPLASAAVCTSAPSGRGYVGMAGELLEARRADVAAGVDARRTVRNYDNFGTWQVLADLERAIGGTSSGDPALKDPGVGASFGVVPRRWYSEGEVGPFAVFVTFNFAFSACQRTIDAPLNANKIGWYEHTQFEPTESRARQFCSRTQAAAWLRDPSEAELGVCVDLALNLAEEPDFKRRWAYVCAAVVSSANWLSI